MERFYKIVDKERGIAQITTDGERWYVRETEDPKTKVRSFIYLPSSSWISSFYPKGIGYMKWLADKGWDESETIKEERGKHGTKVHKAVELLLAGEELKMDAQILNPKTEQMEGLTVEEYGAVISFADWYKTLKNPKLVESEFTIWNEKDGYAGTLDLVLEIDGENWLIDLKTSQSIWPSHEIQVASYAHALKITKKPRLAILQLGYKKNKNNYKFTELEDKYALFLATKQVWANECSTIKPLQKDYPLVVSLGVIPNMTMGAKPKKVAPFTAFVEKKPKKKVTKTKKK